MYILASLYWLISSFVYCCQGLALVLVSHKTKKVWFGDVYVHFVTHFVWIFSHRRFNLSFVDNQILDNFLAKNHSFLLSFVIVLIFSVKFRVQGKF